MAPTVFFPNLSVFFEGSFFPTSLCPLFRTLFFGHYPLYSDFNSKKNGPAAPDYRNAL
jgi:hypothetical protein